LTLRVTVACGAFDLARTPIGVTITHPKPLSREWSWCCSRSGVQAERWPRQGCLGFRYRLGGRGSRRVQRGGFASERDASEALERALERVRRSEAAVARWRSASWSMSTWRSTTASRRRSRNCAGCWGSRSRLSALVGCQSFAAAPADATFAARQRIRPFL